MENKKKTWKFFNKTTIAIVWVLLFFALIINPSAKNVANVFMLSLGWGVVSLWCWWNNKKKQKPLNGK